MTKYSWKEISNWLIAGLVLATGLFVPAQTDLEAQNSKRDQLVIGDREKMRGDDFWIYDDLQSAFETARKESKPLMVVLRCIP